jgi:hypothetical protein
MLAQYEYHEIAESLCFHDLLTFVRQFKECMRFSCFVEGVAERTDAIRLATALHDVKTRPLGYPTPSSVMVRAKILEPGERCLRIKSILPKERMTVVANYYELAHTTLENVAVVKLLGVSPSNFWKKYQRTSRLMYNKSRSNGFP